MADEETTSTPTPAEEPTATPPEAVAAPTTLEVAPSEPVIEPPPAEPQTAQIPLNEPLPVNPEPIGLESAPVDGPLPSEPSPSREATAGQSEPIAPPPEPPQAASAQVAAAPITTGNSRDMFVKARAVIQERKQKKLDKIMEALNTKEKITNDEVERLLHVSDATATRYLSALEKDGKIKQVGKTGIGVVYTKV